MLHWIEVRMNYRCCAGCTTSSCRSTATVSQWTSRPLSKGLWQPSLLLLQAWPTCGPLPWSSQEEARPLYSWRQSFLSETMWVANFFLQRFGQACQGMWVARFPSWPGGGMQHSNVLMLEDCLHQKSKGHSPKNYMTRCRKPVMSWLRCGLCWNRLVKHGSHTPSASMPWGFLSAHVWMWSCNGRPRSNMIHLQLFATMWWSCYLPSPSKRSPIVGSMLLQRWRCLLWKSRNRVMFHSVNWPKTAPWKTQDPCWKRRASRLAKASEWRRTRRPVASWWRSRVSRWKLTWERGWFGRSRRRSSCLTLGQCSFRSPSPPWSQISAVACHMRTLRCACISRRPRSA